MDRGRSGIYSTGSVGAVPKYNEQFQDSRNPGKSECKRSGQPAGMAGCSLHIRVCSGSAVSGTGSHRKTVQGHIPVVSGDMPAHSRLTCSCYNTFL